MSAADPLPVVIADTNAITYGPWRLESAAWKVLLAQSRVGSIRLVVAEVVVRECVGQYRQKLGEKVSEIAVSNRKVREMAGSAPEYHVDLDASCIAYEAFLRDLLVSCAVEVPEIPDVDIAKMVDHAIARRRPFNDAGSGFRDSLLWSTVLDHLGSGEAGTVHLISNDKKAFADGSGHLHPQLVEDIAELGLDAKPLLYSDLAAYFGAVEEVDHTILAAMVERVDQQQEELAELVGNELNGYDVAIDRFPLFSGAIWEPSNIRLEFVSMSATSGDDHLSLVRLRLTTSVRLDITSAHATPQNFEIETTLRCAVDVAFDDREGAFADPEIIVPPLEALPGVAEMLWAYDHSPAANSLPTAVRWNSPEVVAALESLRQVTDISLPPGFADAVREASERLISPGIVEAIRQAAEVSVPPAIIEAARRAAESGISPEILESVRKMSELSMLPGFAETIRKAAEMQELIGLDHEGLDTTDDEDEHGGDDGEGSGPAS